MACRRALRRLRDCRGHAAGGAWARKASPWSDQLTSREVARSWPDGTGAARTRRWHGWHGWHGMAHPASAWASRPCPPPACCRCRYVTFPAATILTDKMTYHHGTCGIVGRSTRKGTEDHWYLAHNQPAHAARRARGRRGFAATERTRTRRSDRSVGRRLPHHPRHDVSYVRPVHRGDVCVMCGPVPPRRR